MKRVFNFLAMFRRERQPGDLVFAVAFFVIALAAAAVLPQEASFTAGKQLVAQPGFWPAVGVAMMVLFGLAHLVSTVNAPRLPGRLKEVMAWGRSLEFVAWFVAYVTVMPVVGYLPATLILSVTLGIRLGYRSPRAIFASAGFAVAVVLVFRAGLGVRIPAGDLYDLLPPAIRSFAIMNL
ncbi:tripartite tricarboxylate transporter TctB family protein [Sagittula stellata]|uniref:DUF1468 domain-containing protein n=1 Tax=Sagittula stellata (strain ATCC 700073 / DSM 11524 / E-37) TaxID=388399 RepID=A3K7B0_SAGS3|nr:tripartite tricarboxylate transporter TctB family protein [Sagittula stellata]EBA06869.1 hypothetical protein SSE37_00320 [Sagittula stellata E-37]